MTSLCIWRYKWPSRQELAQEYVYMLGMCSFVIRLPQAQTVHYTHDPILESETHSKLEESKDSPEGNNNTKRK